MTDMEDLGTYVNSNINDALETLLHGKETPEEREAALISFIKDYDKSVKEYEIDLRAKATIKDNILVVVAVISAVVGALMSGIFLSLK